MAEKKLIIDGLELHYKGLFDVNLLLKEIDKVIAERGYVKAEKRRAEIVTSTGKEFSMELRHIKEKTEFFELMIKMRIRITELKDADVVKEGIKKKMNKGNVQIIFDAWTTTDYESRWEQKPLFYFLRNLVERIIGKIHTEKYLGELSNDCHYMHDNIKAYLKLFKS